MPYESSYTMYGDDMNTAQIKKYELLGANVHYYRRKCKLTQEQLAERFGVSRRTVSRWETGSNMPDL